MPITSPSPEGTRESRHLADLFLNKQRPGICTIELGRLPFGAAILRPCVTQTRVNTIENVAGNIWTIPIRKVYVPSQSALPQVHFTYRLNGVSPARVGRRLGKGNGNTGIL